MLALQLLCRCSCTASNTPQGADLRLLSIIDDSTAAAASTGGAGAGLRCLVQSRAYPPASNDVFTTTRGGVAVWRWNESRGSNGEEDALLRVRTVVLPGVVPTEGQNSIGDLLVVVALNLHPRSLGTNGTLRTVSTLASNPAFNNLVAGVANSSYRSRSDTAVAATQPLPPNCFGSVSADAFWICA
jgi:hypothetical protein